MNIVGTVKFLPFGYCWRCWGSGVVEDYSIKDTVLTKPCPICTGTRWIMWDEVKSKRGHEYRPSWDKIWMDLAAQISLRSTCDVPDRLIGCVIVSEDNTRVLAIGYNGGAKGDNNVCDYTVDEEIKVGTSRCTCVHAEMNALVKLNQTDPCDKKMYLTISPCNICSKLIVNAGICEVIYIEVYKQEVLDELERLGVRTRKLEF